MNHAEPMNRERRMLVFLFFSFFCFFCFFLFSVFSFFFWNMKGEDNNEWAVRLTKT